MQSITYGAMRPNVTLATVGFAELRSKCLKKFGKIGIMYVGRFVRYLDRDQCGVVNAEELRVGLRDMGLCISDDHFAAIVSALSEKNINDNIEQHYGDGNINNLIASSYIDVNGFIEGLRGNLSQRRRIVLESAFMRLDKSRSGVVDINTLIDNYDVSRHPDVVAGRVAPEEAIQKFISNFQNNNGYLTFEEFCNYYSGISSSISNDEQYELLLIRSWRLDRPATLENKKLDTDGSLSSQLGKSRFKSNEHPLYKTTMMEYGRTIYEHRHDPKWHHAGGFTKNSPGFSGCTSLNTAVTKNRFI